MILRRDYDQHPDNAQHHTILLCSPHHLFASALCSLTITLHRQTMTTRNIFLQSPYKSPSPRYYSHPAKPVHSQPDDNEGCTFLSSAAQQPLPSSGSQFPASTSQPLRTPVKQAHRTPSYTVTHIPNSHLNPQPRHTYTSTTTTAPAFGGGGTKRKSTPLGGSGDAHFSTPPRQRLMTPLGISSAQNAGDSTSGNIVFDRLAPFQSWRACNEEAGTFKAGFARVVGECESPPFTITDSGKCL
jgi:mitosis inhibitor protein kinase SWE1